VKLQGASETGKLLVDADFVGDCLRLIVCKC
jgi:hypothetical protein